MGALTENHKCPPRILRRMTDAVSTVGVGGLVGALLCFAIEERPAGALVIAAHGTHAIGPVERRKNTVIAWGLGNVAFACDCTSEQEAILLRVQLERGRVLSAEVVPIQAGVNNGRALPSKDANGVFDLLEAIGSSKLERHGDRAVF